MDTRNVTILFVSIVLVASLGIGAAWQPETPHHIVGVPLFAGLLAWALASVDRLTNLRRLALATLLIQMFMHVLGLVLS